MLYQQLGFTQLTSTLKSHLQCKVLCQFLLLPTFLFAWWSGSLLYLRRASGTERKSQGVISCEGIILYQTQHLVKVCPPLLPNKWLRPQQSPTSPMLLLPSFMSTCKNSEAGLLRRFVFAAGGNHTLTPRIILT